jgi:sRNA-binding protein
MGIGVGALVSGAVEFGTTWFSSKKEETKAKSKQRIEIARENTEAKKAEQQTVRRTIEAEAGTKRALINKNMRLMRRVTLAVLLAPLVVGAVIIAATYIAAWWSGTAPSPDFTPLSLFWSQVVAGTPQWWVQALQGVFAFLWAGGEVTNVGAQAGGVVMDHLRNRDTERVAERQAESEGKKAEAEAERERRNREREDRGEEPVDDDAGTIPTPPSGPASSGPPMGVS